MYCARITEEGRPMKEKLSKTKYNNNIDIIIAVWILKNKSIYMQHKSNKSVSLYLQLLVFSASLLPFPYCALGAQTSETNSTLQWDNNNCSQQSTAFRQVHPFVQANKQLIEWSMSTPLSTPICAVTRCYKLHVNITDSQTWRQNHRQAQHTPVNIMPLAPTSAADT